MDMIKTQLNPERIHMSYFDTGRRHTWRTRYIGDCFYNGLVDWVV